MRNLYIRTVAGAGISLSVLLAYILLLNGLRGSSLREALAKPFYAFSQPAIALGEHYFGQAPIPIFAVLGFHWALAGGVASLLYSIVIRSRGNK